MKRYLGLILAAFLLLSLFAGCGGSGSPDSTDQTTAASGTVPATTVDPFDVTYSASWTDEQWLAYEQQLDFGGYKFKLSITDSGRTPFALGEDGTAPEGQVYDEWRDTINDLEADLNVDIEYVPGVADDSEQYYAYVLAGQNPADFYEIKTHTWFPLYAKRALVKLNSDEIKQSGFDVDNPKLFYQPFTHAWDVNGDTYGVRYASRYYLPEAGWVLYYNKALVKAAGVEDICKVVRDGDWTFDYFLDLARKITKDTDADGTNDVWGIATGYLGYGEEVLLTGGKIVDWVDGKLTTQINSAQALKAYQFLDSVANSGYIVQTKEGANPTYREGHIMFKQGEVGLLWSEMNKASPLGRDPSDLWDASIDFGILPTPKADKNSDYANVLGGVKYDVMLITNPDKAKSAAIYAAFSRRQNDEDVESNIALYLQDENDRDSMDMLTNYIFSKPVANWSWCSVKHNDTYRQEVVYRIFDTGDSVSAIVESAKPVLQSILDELTK